MILTKSDQKLLVFGLENGFKFMKRDQTIFKSNCKFYNSVSKLIKNSFLSSINGLENTYKLTDLGILYASCLTDKENPKIYYILNVMY